jgi:hypothetical protein
MLSFEVRAPLGHVEAKVIDTHWLLGPVRGQTRGGGVGRRLAVVAVWGLLLFFGLLPKTVTPKRCDTIDQLPET